MIRPLPTSSFGHLATGEQQSRQPPSPINLPIPTPNVRTTKITAHPPKSRKSQSSPDNPPVQTTLPPHAPNIAAKEITAHLPKSQKSQSSPDNPPVQTTPPSPRPTLAPHKSQPISQNPLNHSSDNLPVQTTSPQNLAQSLRIPRFLTTTSISGIIFNGITVSSLALTLTRIVTRLVCLNAAQACTPVSSCSRSFPATTATACESNIAAIHSWLSARLGESPVNADQMELFLPFSRLKARDIIRVDRISCKRTDRGKALSPLLL